MSATRSPGAETATATTDGGHPVQHAVELLVERHGVSAMIALDMLGRAARRKGTSVYDLAQHVLGIGGDGRPMPSPRADRATAPGDRLLAETASGGLNDGTAARVPAWLRASNPA